MMQPHGRRLIRVVIDYYNLPPSGTRNNAIPHGYMFVRVVIDCYQLPLSGIRNNAIPLVINLLGCSKIVFSYHHLVLYCF